MEIRNELWMDSLNLQRKGVCLADVYDEIISKMAWDCNFECDLFDALVENTCTMDEIYPIGSLDEELEGYSATEIIDLYRCAEGDIDTAECFYLDASELVFFDTREGYIRDNVSMETLIDIVFNYLQPDETLVQMLFDACDAILCDSEMDDIFELYIESKGDEFYLSCIEYFLEQYGIEFADPEEQTAIDFWLSQF